MTPRPRNRLLAVHLDEASLGGGPPEQTVERRVAIHDLVDVNEVAVPGREGPYVLRIALHERKLLLDLRDEADAPIVAHLLSLTPLKGIVRDYFLQCEAYYAAVRTEGPHRVEAIDMARRALHDEAARLLTERLEGKLAVDHDTARRLFTLIAALHRRG